MKILASDLDGTLWFREMEGHVYKEDIDAIKAFQKAGHLFGMCSGRTYVGLQNALSDVDIDIDFYITCSGGQLRLKDGTWVYRNMFDQATIHDLLDILLEYPDIQIIICRDEHYYRYQCVNMGMHGKNMEKGSYPDHDSFDSMHLGFKNKDLLLKIKELLESRFASMIEVHHNVLNLDITPNGVSKGNAIRFLKDYYRLDLKDIGAIGDSYNDISMLDATPTSFTFHNSEEGVKSHATYQVDRLAQAIQIMVED